MMSQDIYILIQNAECAISVLLQLRYRYVDTATRLRTPNPPRLLSSLRT
jgi:hypothetical protein